MRLPACLSQTVGVAGRWKGVTMYRVPFPAFVTSSGDVDYRRGGGIETEASNGSDWCMEGSKTVAKSLD